MSRRAKPAIKKKVPAKPIGAEQKSRMEYQAAQLVVWGRMLLGEPFNSTPGDPSETLSKAYRDISEGRHLREPFMFDSDRLGIASFLFSLTQPEKLEALTAEKKRPRGAPPTRGTAVRNWNIALDYKLTFERLGKASAAESEVLKAWHIGRTILTDANRDCPKHPRWDEWEQYERHRARVDSPKMSDDELSRKISQHLRNPGNSGE